MGKGEESKGRREGGDKTGERTGADDQRHLIQDKGR